MTGDPRARAVLVLEDGRSFAGRPFGAEGVTVGEAVFATGMTGYQETLTDPSYRRQVVVFTAPHVGNTGWVPDDDESDRVWAAGVVVRDPARRASSWRSRSALPAELAARGVVGIAGIDTRALTRHLRERGAMRVGVASGPAAEGDRGMAALLARVREAPAMAGADLTAEVTTPSPYRVAPAGPHRFTVAALDLGIKRQTPRRLAARGVEVHVLPAASGVDDVLRTRADGVLLSNGPGDPATADAATALTRDILARGVPVLGICLGHQVLGRALGLPTYKLRFGHRGLNAPVQDFATGRVEVTAHNHGFAVRAPLDGPFRTGLGAAEVSHVGLNDRVVEGLRCRDVPAFSVQYHPEAAAGPHDADHLFDRFVAMLERGRSAAA